MFVLSLSLLKNHFYDFKVVVIILKVLGKSVGGENAKVPRYEVKW